MSLTQSTSGLGAALFSESAVPPHQPANLRLSAPEVLCLPQDLHESDLHGDDGAYFCLTC